jgi:putative ABC transport system substrate-binding protein
VTEQVTEAGEIAQVRIMLMPGRAEIDEMDTVVRLYRDQRSGKMSDTCHLENGFLGLVLALLLALNCPAGAQQPAKIPVIGYLGASSATGNDRIDAFRQGLRDLGYVEGKNIVFEMRFAKGKRDRLPALAAELVHLKVDVIVTGGGNATRAARKATSTIPIVMTQSGDPVAEGFVASLARPGGNVTGLSRLTPELNRKRLEILKEVIPGLSRVVIFGTSTNRYNARSLKETRDAAGALGVKLQYIDVLGPKDFEPAFRAANERQADAVLVAVWGVVLNRYQTKFAELAVESRLPAMYEQREYVEAGGLMTYGVSEVDLTRRAATYVDKILKGRNPADLPVEQPRKFDLVINLKTARQIGLTMPPSLLYRATEVIK